MPPTAIVGERRGPLSAAAFPVMVVEKTPYIAVTGLKQTPR